jgi:hypothetical protein
MRRMKDPSIGFEPLGNDGSHRNALLAPFPQALLDPARSGCVLHQLDSAFGFVQRHGPLLDPSSLDAQVALLQIASLAKLVGWTFVRHLPSL